MKFFNIVLVFLTLNFYNATWADWKSDYTYMPSEGYVPDAKTAKLIAEAIWIPIYSEKQIESEKPFKAVLKNDIWIVEGTYHSKAYFGGTAYIRISKKDGRILQCLHSM